MDFPKNEEEYKHMKKVVAVLLAALMILSCTAALAENIKLDKLTFEFVPSKDADVIITGTKNLPELVQAEMAKHGYDIGEVDITVGTSYEATGEAMCAGAIDVGWLAGGTYAIYSENKEVDVILTATRAGLSNDSTVPADWNGDANKTLPTDEQVTFYRSLIYATPSAYGKELAAKVNAGEKLGRPGQGQLGCEQHLFFRRLRLSHHVADGKLRRQKDFRSEQRDPQRGLCRCFRSGCR